MNRTTGGNACGATSLQRHATLGRRIQSTAARGHPPVLFNGRPTTASTASPDVCRASSTDYSRTSWRTAILAETGPSGNDAYDASETRLDPRTHNGSSSNSIAISAAETDGAGRTEAGASRAGADDTTDVAGEGGGEYGGTLSAAELRVKLSLAAGSGRLDLTDCRLRALPPGVLELEELEELQLSGNCLTQLPDGISRLTSLRRLGLAGNQLTRLPPGIGALTALEGLWLHGNLLQTLPPQLGTLGALRALSLAGNCLESLPAGSLSGLTSLTDLTLAGNQLTRLPPRELAPLVRLRKLALNGNRLGSQPAGELGLGAHMTALGELMMQGNRLTEVDPAVFECPALTELSLADNELSSLPPAPLAGASSLSRLHLFGNRLSHLPALGSQLAALPALATCWLEGNPLSGATVAGLVAVAGAGGMPKLRTMGLDQQQMAALRQQQQHGQLEGEEQRHGALPASVRVGCVLGSGPGYFKLQYGPQRGGGGGDVAAAAAGDGGAAGGAVGGGDADDEVCSSNEVLVVAFGSAPGTPNWGGLLSKVYKGAVAEAERHFDVLYVADPSRDWYGGGDEATHAYYRARLAAYTRRYRRVLLLGDSMGATAALLFADLATAALAFCPQVDLKEASIRPGRSSDWLDRLRDRLTASVRASAGELVVLTGTWQHDLAQANMLPQRGEEREGARGRNQQLAQDRARPGGQPGGTSWRTRLDSPGGGTSSSSSAGGLERWTSVPASSAHRSPWAWQQEERTSQGGGGAAATELRSSDMNTGGVTVRVFSVDSHRLAAALDARGKLVPIVRDMVLHQLGLRSGNVRVSNLL